MKLKLMKISTKSFVLIFASLNVIAGVLLGAVVTVVSLVNPPEPGSNEVGAWAVLVFPVLNGILGVAAGFFLAGIYNLLTRFFGGIELEFEPIEQ